MRLLLDTHALLWWLLDDPRLVSSARALIGDRANQAWVSAVTPWEIALKHKLGKLEEAEPVIATLPGLLVEQGFRELVVTHRHGLHAGSLPLHHKDPFDRMLAAQAAVEDLTLVSNDAAFDRYGATRVWC